MNSKNSTDFLDLGGRVCVVTGGGSGIGRAIALSFAGLGAHVAVLDRNADAAAACAAEISSQGGAAVAIGCDVSDPASVQAAAERSAAALGPCTVLVNNAGVLRPGPLATLTLAEWNGMLAINLTGYFLCAQAFGLQMREAGGGAMVHTASIAATFPTSFGGAYSVAKAGVVSLSQQLAIEWGSLGIRSNSVSPGLTMTPMTEASYTVPGTSERRNKAIPAGRVAEPQNIADAVLFLASPRSAYITGVDLLVDGGLSSNLMSLIPRTGNSTPGH
jgi:NAD(P)-dependent dehydrogenase (short-subunit alcohol dehydrogenase family)